MICRDNEKKHRLRTRIKLGTRAHLARLGKSSVIITLKNLGAIPQDIPRYFEQVAAPVPDEMVEEIHRGGQAGDPEDEAAVEEEEGEGYDHLDFARTQQLRPHYHSTDTLRSSPQSVQSRC